MKKHIASLTILVLTLTAVQAVSQQVLYDDGPINGTNDAWTINFGYVISNTFEVLHNSTVTGFNFGVWEFPGDTLISLDWSITAQENSGKLLGSGTATGNNLTDHFISVNQYGYDIDEITVSGLKVGLNSGTYWLNLQNAVVPSGDPVFWDENSGIGCGGDDGKGGGCPSMPSGNFIGTIPPESFSVSGSVNSGSTPEPTSFMLFGSGILGLAGVLRRKLF